MSRRSFARAAGPAIAALLAVAGCATRPATPLSWMAVAGQGVPTLMFGLPESDAVDFRLRCAADGVRLAALVGKTLRGVIGDETRFATTLRIFLGNRELLLPAEGLPLGSGGSLVEAVLPDPAGLLSAVERQGRLVAVTYAGRSIAPAPPAGLLADFRKACPAADRSRS